MGNLMLAAHELGIGSCWIHRAKEEFESDWGRNLLRSLGVNGDYEGIGHCALGYADGDYPAAPARNCLLYTSLHSLLGLTIFLTLIGASKRSMGFHRESIGFDNIFYFLYILRL